MKHIRYIFLPFFVFFWWSIVRLEYIESMPSRDESLTGDAYFVQLDEKIEEFWDVYRCASNPHHVDFIAWFGNVHNDKEWEIFPVDGGSSLERKGDQLIYNMTSDPSYSQYFSMDRESFVFISPYMRWDKDAFYGMFELRGPYTTVYETAVWIRPWWCYFTIFIDTDKDVLLRRVPYEIAETQDPMYKPLDFLDPQKSFVIDPHLSEGEIHPFVSDGDVLYWFDKMLSWPDQQPLTLYSWAYENKVGFFLIDYNLYTNDVQQRIPYIDDLISLLDEKITHHFCPDDGESLWQQRGWSSSCKKALKKQIEHVIEDAWRERNKKKALIQKLLSTWEEKIF